MKHHNQEQGQIFEDIPGDGGIAARATLDFVSGDEEPGPMQKHIDAAKSEKDGSILGGRLACVQFTVFQLARSTSARDDEPGGLTLAITGGGRKRLRLIRAGW